MNVEIIFGKTTEHLVGIEGTKFFVHKQVLQDFLRLQRDAAQAGFDLQIISAFRDYNRQLQIWNGKASGERPLLDAQGRPLNASQLSPIEIMYAILRWSALPGASRHHWGTDFDIYDAKTQSASEVQLISSECESNGPAARLHEWLTDVMHSKSAYNFFRPYRTDRGGVSPEPWHISYYPLARRVIDIYTYSLFKRNIEESELLLKEELLENSYEIYQRYLMDVDLP